MLLIISISINEPQQALSLLAETAAQRENKIEIFRKLPRPAESEDDENSDFPISSAFQNAEGSMAILRMTNFTSRELYKLFNKFEDKFKTYRNTGRGRKLSHTSKGVLYVMLCDLKQGCQWDISAKLFRINTIAFGRMIDFFLGMLTKKVFEE